MPTTAKVSVYSLNNPNTALSAIATASADYAEIVTGTSLSDGYFYVYGTIDCLNIGADGATADTLQIKVDLDGDFETTGDQHIITLKADGTNLVPAFVGGDGSSGNAYQIANAAQLNHVRKIATNLNYVQTQNVNVAAYCDSTAGWTPIPTFSGTYNGGTKNISNLKIVLTASDSVGLFAQTTGGSITDVRLTDVVGITGRTYVGALVGNNAASIERCSVTGDGTVSTALTGNTDVYVGGLIGYTNGAISNSYSTLNVGSAGNGNYVGGLVGCLGNGVVVDKCYTTGTVAGNIGVGGITGGCINDTSATVSNCVALGASITGSDSSLIGRITGGNGSTVPSLSGCYAIETMTLTPTRAWNATYDGTSTDEPETAAFWTNAGYSTEVWNIKADSYPTLKNIP